MEDLQKGSGNGIDNMVQQCDVVTIAAAAAEAVEQGTSAAKAAAMISDPLVQNAHSNFSTFLAAEPRAATSQAVGSEAAATQSCAFEATVSETATSQSCALQAASQAAASQAAASLAAMATSQAAVTQSCALQAVFSEAATSQAAASQLAAASQAAAESRIRTVVPTIDLDADSTRVWETSKTESLRPKLSASLVSKTTKYSETSRTRSSEISKLSSSSKDLVTNPLYSPCPSDGDNVISSDSSSDDDELSDDDGIVVVAVKKKGDNAPLVVISDSSGSSDVSSSSSGDSDSDSDENKNRKKLKLATAASKTTGLTELEKSFGQDYRTRPQLLSATGRSSKKFYKASYGSEDSSSSSSVEIVEDGSNRMSLNINVASKSSSLTVGSAAESSFFETAEEETTATAVTLHKWTREMESYYNAAVRDYATADLESLTSGMDSRAEIWRVDRLVVFTFFKIISSAIF